MYPDGTLKRPLSMTPRDLGDGWELATPEAQATAKQTETDYSTSNDVDFGFYFWVVSDVSGFATWGHGGNITLALPEHELVVTITGLPNAGMDVSPKVWDVAELAKTIVGI